MARYMLDTNMCVFLMKNQPESVGRHFAQCYVGDVVMSAITYAELQYGVSVSSNPRREQHNLVQLIEDIPVLPFDDSSAMAYCPIRQATHNAKKDELDKFAFDKLIAAHALSLDLILVTNNLPDFVRYPGLKIENWLE